ncbi:MAG TPA: hypothetical protein VFH48_00680 [Chloroflexota bacterium]|nr:hypothetical protein [Chloroflexota bacterium]
MRLLRSRSLAFAWLAAGALAGGLLVGSAWYATSHNLTAGLLTNLAGQASAQEVAPPGPAAPAPTTSRRPTGEVTEITADPAAFTLRAEDGTLTTYRVLDTTVFMAGHDRPYRFELLKQGDQVVVRGGGAGKVDPAAAASASAQAGKGKGKQAQPTSAQDGELIARQVMVRPAGEKVKGKKGQAASAPANADDGGSDGTRQ